jgi:hypothetical protein
VPVMRIRKTLEWTWCAHSAHLLCSCCVHVVFMPITFPEELMFALLTCKIYKNVQKIDSIILYQRKKSLFKQKRFLFPNPKSEFIFKVVSIQRKYSWFLYRLCFSLRQIFPSRHATHISFHSFFMKFIVITKFSFSTQFFFSNILFCSGWLRAT